MDNFKLLVVFYYKRLTKYMLIFKIFKIYIYIYIYESRYDMIINVIDVFLFF